MSDLEDLIIYSDLQISTWCRESIDTPIWKEGSRFKLTKEECEQKADEMIERWQRFKAALPLGESYESRERNTY